MHVYSVNYIDKIEMFFDEVPAGEVFYPTEDINNPPNYYLKLEYFFDLPFYNAVELKSGKIVHFDHNDFVTMIKDW